MVSEGEMKIQGNPIYIEDGATTGRWTMDQWCRLWPSGIKWQWEPQRECCQEGS